MPIRRWLLGIDEFFQEILTVMTNCEFELSKTDEVVSSIQKGVAMVDKATKIVRKIAELSRFA